MRLLIILFLGFVLYLAVKVLIGVVFLSGQRRKQRERSDGEMVRDPVCETYVTRRQAIEKNVGGQTLYFCSQKCQDAFLEKRRAT